MHYVLYFLVVLAFLPGAHWVCLRHPSMQTPGFVLAGFGAWVCTRLLIGNTPVHFLGAVGAALSAIIIYDRIFAVRFQEWIEGGGEGEE